MEKSKHKRESYIDIAKTIGIILVVLGHTDFIGKNIIYQFHLPLFFFLSGVVFNLDKVDNLKEFFYRRVKGLYVPFIIFEIISLLLHNFFSLIHFYTDLSNVKVIYDFSDFIKMVFKIITLGGGEQLVGPLWFLISTLEINIIFAIFMKWLKKYTKKYNIIVFIICIILFFIGCYTDLPRMLSQSLIGMFFYCCGYIFKINKEKVKFNIYLLLIALVTVLFCSKINYVDISQLEIRYKSLLIISGLAGTYAVLYISQKAKILENKFLLYCGKNTIYILALHCIFFKFIMLIEIFIYNVDINYLGLFPTYQHSQIWSIPLTILGVVGPILVSYIVKKIANIRGGKECTKSQ